MSAPVYQAIGSAADGTTSCTPAWPTHDTGDLGIMFVLSRGTGVSTPSGWSDAPVRLIDSGTTRYYCFYRFATSSAESSPSVTGGTNVTNAVIITVRNAHRTNPFHRFVTTLGNNVTAVVVPSFTTEIDDILVMQSAWVAADSAGPFFSSESNSSLGSLTERFDAGTITGNGGGYGIWTGTMASPGVVASTTVTSVNNIIGSLSIAIAPHADQTISGTVEVDGVVASNTSSGTPKVYAYDKTQPAASSLVAASDISGGTGSFSLSVPYSDHVYIPIFERLVSEDPDVWEMCAGDPVQSGGDPILIEHFSTAGGGGGSTYSRSQVVNR